MLTDRPAGVCIVCWVKRPAPPGVLCVACAASPPRCVRRGCGALTAPGSALCHAHLSLVIIELRRGHRKPREEDGDE